MTERETGATSGAGGAEPRTQGSPGWDDGPRPGDAQLPRRSWIQNLRPLLRHRLGLFGGIVVVALILVALLAPVLAPHPPDVSNLQHSLAGPGEQFLLGADKQGRDILSRILFGARTSLSGALLVVLLSELIGVPLGLAAGYFGGKLDMVVSRFLDILLSFPALLLAFAIVAVFGRGMTMAVVALGIVYVPMIARVVRAVTITEREMVYVEAARSLGASHTRVLLRHILPNVASPIIVQSTIDLGYAILDLAALNFLGLGVQPPTPDWGAMLAEGREYLLFAPWEAIASGLAIMVAVMAFNLSGDALRQFLDPRQRRTMG